MIRFRTLVASYAVVSTFSFPPHSSAGDSESARERYQVFLAELRAARTLDLDADVVVSRYRAGVTSRSTGTLSATLGRGDRGRLLRARDEKSTAQGEVDSGSQSIEILADGDVAYHVDREARAYVRVWPPRFLAGGENRSILPLRVFLEEAIEEPDAIEFRRHPKQSEWSGFQLDYSGWNEVAYFDREGALRSWVRTDDIDGMRSNFSFEHFLPDRGGDPASCARRPPDEFRDVTSRHARGARTSFTPAETITTLDLPSTKHAPLSVFAPGVREVEAGFVDAAGALIRLSSMRGRPVVLTFLDRTAPQCLDAAKRLSRLAAEFEAKGARVEFLAVVADDPPLSRRDVPKNLRFVKSLARDIERIFSIYYHPTTFVIDRRGVVVLRGSIGFDEAAIRETVGDS